MKKIVFYNGSAGFGGAEHYLISLISGLKSRGYAVSLITIRTPHIQHFKEALKEVKILQTPGFFSFPAILAEIRLNKPDAVFLNFHYPAANLSAAIAAKLAGVPRIIGSVHFVEPLTSKFPLGRQIKKLITKIVFPLLDKAIISSNKCRSQLIENYGIPARKIELVHNGIDTASFPKAVIDDEKSVFNKTAPVTIGMVGRLVKGKGHDVFIKAAAEVLSSNNDARFLIVGDGPLLDRMKKITKDLNISKDVIFSGYQKDLFSCIAEMDIAVLPSLHETFPYVVLEYMAMSKPVISSDVGGVPEMIEDGSTGLLVPPGDAKALAKAILRLINDRDRSVKMGLNGRRRIEGHFTLDKMIDNTLKVINDPK